MKNNRKTFSPALRWHSLTRLFDFFMAATMPELALREALISQASLASGAAVLDFGCGTGTLDILLKRQFPNLRLTGVDVDEKVIAIALEKSRKSGVAIELLTYDGERLPFPGNSFDRVLSSLVFHHIPTAGKRVALKEIRRVLRPDGELHIMDFCKPQTTWDKLTFAFFRRFDGVENTQVNADGLLPAFVSDAGFGQVEESAFFTTIFGSVSLIAAKYIR